MLSTVPHRAEVASPTSGPDSQSLEPAPTSNSCGPPTPRGESHHIRRSPSPSLLHTHHRGRTSAVRAGRVQHRNHLCDTCPFPAHFEHPYAGLSATTRTIRRDCSAARSGSQRTTSRRPFNRLYPPRASLQMNRRRYWLTVKESRLGTWCLAHARADRAPALQRQIETSTMSTNLDSSKPPARTEPEGSTECGRSHCNSRLSSLAYCRPQPHATKDRQ